MKNLKYIIIIFSAALLSCSPKINVQLDESMPPLSVENDVVVFGLEHSPPDSSVLVGNLKSGGMMHTGTYTNTCDYKDVISILKEKAKSLGTYIIKINNFVYSNFSSKCIKIDASIYYFKDQKLAVEEYYKENILSMNRDEATIHYMRPYTDPGSKLEAFIYSDLENLPISHFFCTLTMLPFHL